MTGPHTGSLNGAGHQTFAEGALRLARDMVEDVQRLLVSSAGSMAELSEAASVAHTYVDRLVKGIRSGSLSLGSENQETQVSRDRETVCCVAT